MNRKTPSYAQLRPARPSASAAARGASKKRDTRCEIALRRAIWALGLRYRIAVPDLPGRPDIVFRSQRVVVFCDGDFWHGRNLEQRIKKLANGHNAPYWVGKIQTNVARDRRTDQLLQEAGWTVIRLWETDILHDSASVAAQVARIVRLEQ